MFEFCIFWSKRLPEAERENYIDMIEVCISSEERRALYNKAFKTLSNRKKIVIWICLLIMFAISVSLIRVNTNYFSMRLEDNPNKIVGIIALVFAFSVALLMILLPFLSMNRLKRNLPEKTMICVSDEELQVNQIRVNKTDICEILKMDDFLFAVTQKNGQYRYVIVPFLTDVRQTILSKLNEYGYPKIEEIDSNKEFPWIHGH